MNVSFFSSRSEFLVFAVSLPFLTRDVFESSLSSMKSSESTSTSFFSFDNFDLSLNFFGEAFGEAFGDAGSVLEDARDLAGIASPSKRSPALNIFKKTYTGDRIEYSGDPNY